MLKRTKKRSFIIGFVAAGVVGWASWSALAGAEEDNAPPRVAGIQHLMSGINGPNFGALNKALKDNGPQDDKAWEAVASEAALLNESGHLLMQNNRCPDAVWAEAAKALREGSSAVYEAASKKDLKAAQEAAKNVGASCAACHTKHKDRPKPPPKDARVADIKHIMANLNNPHCAAIGNSLKDAGPADDKTWNEIISHAAMLNEVSFILMDNNRCPDEVWKNACSQLREGANKVTFAATTKNLEEARLAMKEVTGACGACHKAHKKPTA